MTLFTDAPVSLRVGEREVQTVLRKMVPDIQLESKDKDINQSLQLAVGRQKDESDYPFSGGVGRC
jgi:hypothetical protein